ncbi:MAG: polysaccharide deacetylase family protein, partial [Rhodothermales bacterium]|nr:polysaccharide deacetylase family protein [Rhodothermales bacterium]
MRIPGVKKARLAGRWIRGRLSGGTVVLGYHRVANPRNDVYDICITPGHFEQHLEVLRRRANVVTLSHAVETSASGNQAPHAVVVTFDDGYSEVADSVRLLLERYEIPATVFIPSGSLGKELWWDRLERIVSYPQVLPPLRELSSYGLEMRSEIDKTGNRSAKTSDSREQVVRSLYQALLPLSGDERDLWLARIERWAGAPTSADKGARIVSESELIELAACDLITIGSHSVSHPVLPELSSSDQKIEIADSKRDLEGLIGRSVEFFSYPNG